MQYVYMICDVLFAREWLVRYNNLLTHYQTTKVLDWSNMKQIADNILKGI